MFFNLILKFGDLYTKLENVNFWVKLYEASALFFFTCFLF